MLNNAPEPGAGYQPSKLSMMPKNIYQRANNHVSFFWFLTVALMCKAHFLYKCPPSSSKPINAWQIHFKKRNKIIILCTELGFFTFLFLFKELKFGTNISDVFFFPPTLNICQYILDVIQPFPTKNPSPPIFYILLQHRSIKFHIFQLFCNKVSHQSYEPLPTAQEQFAECHIKQ